MVLPLGSRGAGLFRRTSGFRGVHAGPSQHFARPKTHFSPLGHRFNEIVVSLRALM